MRRATTLAVIGLLAGSALCVGIAPLLMPDGYSLVVNEVSETGAQGVLHAWVTHLGFLLFGFAVIVLAEETCRIWPEWARWAHRVFGGSVILTAVFSDSPWFERDYDLVEDMIHSVAAGFVGAAFTVGVLLLALWRGSMFTRTFDGFAALATLVIPTLMFFANDVAGAAERVMFAIAYLWYGGEALRALRAGPHHAGPGVDHMGVDDPPGTDGSLGARLSRLSAPVVTRVLSDPPRGWFDLRTTAHVAVGMLAASLTAIAAAPLFMPPSYSPVALSVSESAAQGVEHAWIARAGFLLFGLAVLLLASRAGRAWGRWGSIAHRTYGVAMIASAAFSHLPWEEGISADAFEDLLHSVAASAIGFAFTIGVLLVTILPRPRPVRVFDAIAVVAAVVIPMTMLNVEAIAGLLQRLLFLIGYLWYGLEAVRMRRDAASAVPAPSRRRERGVETPGPSPLPRTNTAGDDQPEGARP